MALPDSVRDIQDPRDSDQDDAVAGPSAEVTAPTRHRGLLDRDWQKALIVLLTLLAAAALVWLIVQVITPILRTILLFVFSAVLAFVLSPPVNALAARIGSRLLAIAIVYLVVGVVVVGGLVLLAGPFVGQVTVLVNDLPRYGDELNRQLPAIEQALRRYGLDTTISDLRVNAANVVQAQGANVLKSLVQTVTDIGGGVVDMVLALVISLYLLHDGPTIRARILAVIPDEHRAKALFLEANTARVLGGYLRGQLVMAVTIGILAGGGCWALGLPYAVVLGVLAGLFELVPMFGPVLGAAPAVAVALFMPFPTVISVIVYFVIVQQVESNVLGPRITGHAVGLHPLGALFALLAGFQLAGLLGALVAVPVAGIIWVLLTAAYRAVPITTPAAPRLTLPRWWRGTSTDRSE
ncbi:MAG: AI-2E family transporter [Chloroflexota bacterium]